MTASQALDVTGTTAEELSSYVVGLADMVAKLTAHRLHSMRDANPAARQRALKLARLDLDSLAAVLAGAGDAPTIRMAIELVGRVIAQLDALAAEEG